MLVLSTQSQILTYNEIGDTHFSNKNKQDFPGNLTFEHFEGLNKTYFSNNTLTEGHMRLKTNRTKHRLLEFKNTGTHQNNKKLQETNGEVLTSGFYLDLWLSYPVFNNPDNLEFDVCIPVDENSWGTANYPGESQLQVLSSNYVMQFTRFCLYSQYTISMCIRTPSNCNDLTGYLLVNSVPQGQTAYVSIESSLTQNADGCYSGYYVANVNGNYQYGFFDNTQYYCTYCNWYNNMAFGMCG